MLPLLDLVQGAQEAPAEDWGLHPFFERLLRPGNVVVFLFFVFWLTVAKRTCLTFWDVMGLLNSKSNSIQKVQMCEGPDCANPIHDQLVACREQRSPGQKVGVPLLVPINLLEMPAPCTNPRAISGIRPQTERNRLTLSS